MKNFSHLVYAGTFDRLHIGHKKLLDKAFKLAEKVSIGITTENLYKSKPLANLILTYEVRRRAVEQYLRERNWLKRARFFRLNNIYGPSIVDKTMDSILVTELTRLNAERINKIRFKNGLPSMKIIVAPLVRGDDGEVVTSERIRLGEIDARGHNFQFSIFPASLKLRGAGNFQNPTSSRLAGLRGARKQLILPNYLRKELRKPLGKLIGGAENQLEQTARKVYRYIDITICPMVITVGDIVTMSLLRVGFDPDVKIIDLRSRRRPLNSKFEYPASFSELRGTSRNSKQYQNSNDKNVIPAKAGYSPFREIQNYIDSHFHGNDEEEGGNDNLENSNLSLDFARDGELVEPFRAAHFVLRTSRDESDFACLPARQGFRISNPAGTIKTQAAKVIKQAIKKFQYHHKKQLIVIEGEEDLLALPAILLAPLHSIVLYGQIDLGIVMVEATEEKKREVEGILRKFD